MRYTNKQLLPEPIVNAIINDDYNHGADISVTGLINPPRLRILVKRHWDDERMVQDVADCVWRLFGKLIHLLLAQGAKEENALVEERVYLEVDGVKVSGSPDIFYKNTGVLDDYKTTSVFSFQKNKLDWEQQLNLYAYLLKKAKGLEVKELMNRAILRDHMKSKTVEHDYPPSIVMTRQVRLWDEVEQEGFLRERVRIHKEAERLPDEDLPECSLGECWGRPEAWAVKAEGSKVASKVITEQGDKGHAIAEAYMADIQARQPKKVYFIEHRLGVRNRCEGNCLAAPFCHQFKQYKQLKFNVSDRTPSTQQEAE